MCVASAHSVHLYYLFPSLEEGGLATYRTAIVQNQHLAMLAKVRAQPKLRPPQGAVPLLFSCPSSPLLSLPLPVWEKESVCLPLQVCNWS